MAKAEICSGICGFTTTVVTSTNDTTCKVSIQSECSNVQRLAAELTEVDPIREITFRGEGPLTLQLARKYCPHTSCPVASGIIKAVEVESGLALPADATIKVSRSNE